MSGSVTGTDIIEQAYKLNISFETHQSKKDRKGLVARQPSSTRQERQQHKEKIRKFLNIRFSTAVPEETFVPEAKTSSTFTKITFSLKTPSGDLQTYTIYNLGCKIICVNDQQKAVKFTTSEILDLFIPEMLSKIFKGDRIEYYNYPEFSSNPDFKRHEPDEFWDRWEQKSPSSWEIYKQIIHPAMASAAIQILNLIAVSLRPVVLELGGGCGSLAHKIIDGFGKELEYTLLEYNDRQIIKARNLLGAKACIVKSDIVADEIYYEKSVDFALASGVLTSVVLKDKAAAAKVLKKIVAVLKPDGYLLLSGHGDSFFEASDFEESGFKVINTSLPGLQLYFYILQKK